MKHLDMTCLGPVLLVSATIAQTSLTIPQSAATRDGRTSSQIAGFTQRQRQQILLGPSLLSAALNRKLTAITFRRDGLPNEAKPGRCSLRVTASHSPRSDALEASETFALNRGLDQTVVFTGEITLPAAPPPANRDAVTWSGVDVVTIPFAPGFTYRGSVLCLEIEGEPVQGAVSGWWSVDHERDGVAGTQTNLGQPCGPTAAGAANTAHVDTWSLRAGSSITLSAMAQPFSPGALILGIQALPTPLNLGFLGAPTCTLEINTDLLLPTLTGARPYPLWPAFTHQQLQLGNQAASMGAVMYAQWVHVEGAALTTTNALRMQVAAAPITLAASTILSAVTLGSYPELGRAQTGVAPVFRLSLR